MATAGAFFVTVSHIIHGYHVYKEVWNPSIQESFMIIKDGVEINGEIALPLQQVLKLEVSRTLEMANKSNF